VVPDQSCEYGDVQGKPPCVRRAHPLQLSDANPPTFPPQPYHKQTPLWTSIQATILQGRPDQCDQPQPAIWTATIDFPSQLKHRTHLDLLSRQQPPPQQIAVTACPHLWTSQCLPSLPDSIPRNRRSPPLRTFNYIACCGPFAYRDTCVHRCACPNVRAVLSDCSS
jgi:hypothetical protein